MGHGSNSTQRERQGGYAIASNVSSNWRLRCHQLACSSNHQLVGVALGGVAFGCMPYCRAYVTVTQQIAVSVRIALFTLMEYSFCAEFDSIEIPQTSLCFSVPLGGSSWHLVFSSHSMVSRYAPSRS